MGRSREGGGEGVKENANPEPKESPQREGIAAAERPWRAGT